MQWRRDLYRPRGMRPGHRKATKGSTVKLPFTVLERSEVADMAYSILTNHYMNGSIVDIHGGYDYFCK